MEVMRRGESATAAWIHRQPTTTDDNQRPHDARTRRSSSGVRCDASGQSRARMPIRSGGGESPEQWTAVRQAGPWRSDDERSECETVDERSSSVLGEAGSGLAHSGSSDMQHEGGRNHGEGVLDEPESKWCALHGGAHIAECHAREWARRSVEHEPQQKLQIETREE